MVVSFILCMVVFATIGVYSARYSSGTTEDYLLASRKVPAWLTGLSAVASNSSGWMFIGLIGYIYLEGFAALWMLIGWPIGDYTASRLYYEKVRITASKHNIVSFSGLLSKWHGHEQPSIRITVAILVTIFLAAYASTQLVSGSKALYVLLGWDYATGAMLGTVMVLVYCLAGGIRASIWTDAAQSFVMTFAMGMLCVVAIHDLGGLSSFLSQLHHVSPDYTSWFPENEMFGAYTNIALIMVGWIAGGIGVAGQPHIMVRFMAIKDVRDISRARVFYYGWLLSFYVLCTGVALAARLYIPYDGNFDVELALPQLTTELFPAIGVGVVLAGIFAATMSTADSQILSCTAAVTQDILPSKRNSLLFNKLTTLAIALFALAIALSNNESVFSLVLIAWSGMASAFLPLLTLLVMGRKPSEATGLLMVISGFIASVGWKYLGPSDILYEIVPGFMAGFVVYGIGTLWTMIFAKNAEEDP